MKDVELTFEMSHCFMPPPWNALAPEKVPVIVSTFDVSHADRLPLNFVDPLNIQFILITLEVSVEKLRGIINQNEYEKFIIIEMPENTCSPQPDISISSLKSLS